jgi:putative transcriptional regulator
VLNSPSLVGRLLVATPDLSDPNFRRTVIYVLQHGPVGALGLVLNRPTGHDIPDSLTPWKSRTAPPDVVFRGGPVQPDGIIALGRQRSGMVETVDLVNAQPYDFDEIRMFHGYAGWSSEQLEGEIDEGSWFTLDAIVDDVFCVAPAAQWRAVLGRQTGTLRWLANFPDEPALN